MIPRHALLASRIRQELSELDRVVERVEQATRARQQAGAEPDFLLDSAALNLHGLYVGLEGVFTQIASTMDQSVASGSDSHRELLRQMAVEVPGLRPRVLSPNTAAAIDEYLRFQHVVRHACAFQLEPERVESLAARLPLAFRDIGRELEAFAAFLDDLAQSA